MGSELGQFFYYRRETGPPVSVPLGFARWKGGISVVVTGAVSTTVFNTQRTTSKERAAAIIESMVLPSLGAFVKANFSEEISHFGIAILYGSEDFAADPSSLFSVLDKEAEMVGFVADRSACQKFVLGEITQEEFISKSAVFISDRDMMSGIKRITITID